MIRPVTPPLQAPRRAARLITAAVLVAAAGLASGCASGPHAADDTLVIPDSRAGEGLARLARQERSRPVRRAMQAPPPPGVDAASIAPVEPGDERARVPLDQVVARLALEPPLPEPIGPNPPGAGAPGDLPHDPPTEEAVAQALRAYIAGRQRLLEGDEQRAIAEFQAAARLDPAAAAPWRAIGDANLARADRIAAAAAFREAVARDPDDPHTLTRLGLALIERREHAQAAAILARAYAALRPDSDWALPLVISAGLGGALIAEGYLAAGAEALTRAVDLPDRVEQPTIYMAELAEIHRERGDSWREAGDAWCRLTQFEDALRAYDAASEFPTFDPGAIPPRRVNAAMRLGRPAYAGQVVVAGIIEVRGSLEDRQLRLIEHLARYSDTGPALADAIEGVSATLDDRSRALSAGRLVRARAAALPDAPARALLRTRIDAAPSDDSAISDLFHRQDPRNSDALLRETIGLIESSPLQESRYILALLRVQPSARTLLDAMPEPERGQPERPAAALVRARLIEVSGDLPAAESALRALVAAHPTFAPGVVALAKMLDATGRDDEATALLDTIDESQDIELRYAKALALQSMRRPVEALETLAPLLLEQASADAARQAPLWITAAELHMSLQQWSEAEEACRRALSLDPTLEEGYAGLITLYAPGGALADQGRLGDAVRALRAAIPSSRVLRWLRAQDLVRAGLLDQAERELLSLAEDEPVRNVVELLVTIWLRTGSEERAEAWLREKERARPTDPVPRIELARVLAASGRADQAAEILRNWLSIRPGDAAAQRRLEQVLRESLGRVEEADLMALERLSRSPRSLSDAILFADIKLRRADVDAAAGALLEALQNRPALSPEDASGVARLTYEIAEKVQAGEGDPRQTLALFDALIRRSRRPPPPCTLLASPSWPSPSAISPASSRLSPSPSPSARTTPLTSAASSSIRSARPGARPMRCESRSMRPLSPAASTSRCSPSGCNSRPRRSISPRRRAVRFAASRSLARALIAENLDVREMTEEQAAASIAVQLAIIFARQGRQEDADELYRLALSYNPAHAMANNNLGYRMLEAGVNLPEAVRLLEAAYTSEPEDHNIVDSLGWARYKTAVFQDELDAAGAIVREGAISLLARAVDLVWREEQTLPNDARAGDVRRELMFGRAIILDHLGDAHWRAGEADLARAKWTTAGAVLETIPADFIRSTADASALRRSIDDKLRALDAGAEPPVAPLAAPGQRDAVLDPAPSAPAS